MKRVKQKLAELNNTPNSQKRKAGSDAILLFIAELTAETNGNVKWMLWMICAAFIIGIGTLITLVMNG